MIYVVRIGNTSIEEETDEPVDKMLERVVRDNRRLIQNQFMQYGGELEIHVEELAERKRGDARLRKDDRLPLGDPEC